MMIGFEGTEVTPDLSVWITERHIGGVVLFSRNMKSMGQTAKLIGKLQGLRATISDQPLLVAVDQEGGAVARLVPGMTVLPGNMALGSIGKEDSAFAAGQITGIEMTLMGFNINFAPVLDISSNPRNPVVGVRSFGSDPETVGRLAASMMEGLQSQGMLATAKHFPGLGACALDPHQGLPVIDADEKQMLQRDIVPFTTVISAGVQLVMTSHAIYRAWETGQVPATFSKRILMDLLRVKLGFHGVIISDDVEMGALMRHFSIAEIARQSVVAGVNIIQCCHTQTTQIALFDSLQMLAMAGGEVEVCMEESLKKIRRLKTLLGENTRHSHATLQTLGIHQQVAQRMARDSITLIKDDVAAVPLRLSKNQKILVLEPAYAMQTQVEDREITRNEDDAPMLRFIRTFHANTQWKKFNLSPTDADARLIPLAKTFDVVLLLTYNAHLVPDQMEFARQIVAQHPQAIIAAIRNPYDLIELGDAPTQLATYGFRVCSIKALIEVLFGDVIPNGIMPVQLEKSGGKGT